MKETLIAFLKEFNNCSTEEQLSVYQEIKGNFKKILSEKGDVTEKTLCYLKDVFKSEFPDK